VRRRGGRRVRGQGYLREQRWVAHSDGIAEAAGNQRLEGEVPGRRRGDEAK
jgi:hypothetical protein